MDADAANSPLVFGIMKFHRGKIRVLNTDFRYSVKTRLEVSPSECQRLDPRGICRGDRERAAVPIVSLSSEARTNRRSARGKEAVAKSSGSELDVA